MDGKTKFSLDISLDKWKSQLVEMGHIEEGDMIELESHLLDSMDNLKSKGLDDDEAFFIAKKRLGSIELLEKEYEKVKPGQALSSKLNLLAKGMLLYLFLDGFNRFIYDAIIVGANSMGVNKDALQFVGITIVCVLGVAYVLSFFLSFQNGRVLNHRWLRVPNLIIGILLFHGFTAAAQPWALSEMNHNLFGEIRVSLYIFNAVFLLTMLAFMYVVYLNDKKPLKENLSRT